MAKEKDDAQTHAGHRLRLKNRFLRNGLSGFEEHEILELLLFFAIPQKNTNDLAHHMIARFDGLKQVLSADPDMLMTCHGISAHSTTLLKLVWELGEWRAQQKMKKDLNGLDQEAAGNFFVEWFSGQQEENLIAIFLDASGRKIGGVVELAKGSLQHVAIPTVRIMEELTLRHASSFLLAHNHPDGTLVPSRADTEATEKLYRVFSVLGTPLKEHYLIAGDRYLPLITYLQDNLRLQ